MTTSNLNDLSSFEPEAILASLPGDHPKMAGVLAIGREASETGHLDVAELSRIANEIYTQGFPVGSPFASAGAPEIPSTASFPEAKAPNSLHGAGVTPTAYIPTFSPVVSDGIALGGVSPTLPGLLVAAVAPG